jgi:hypothetical protein
MKAYKVEILIINHDEVGRDEIKLILENTKYPNRCISPSVQNIVERDIGEWSDEHPLNSIRTANKEYARLFYTF